MADSIRRPMQQELRSLELWRSVISECVGTGFLVFLICGSFVHWSGMPPSAIGVALVTGLGFVCLPKTFGHPSGGHLNPCFTLAAFLARWLTPLRAFMYVAAQFGGGIAGAGLLFATSPRGSVGVTVPVIPEWQAFGVELLISFLVVSVFLKDQKNLGAAAVAATIVAVPATGGSFNPARSLGAAFVANSWRGHWIYWAGPLLGASAAGIIFRISTKRTRKNKKAKVFNDASLTDDEDDLEARAARNVKTRTPVKTTSPSALLYSREAPARLTALSPGENCIYDGSRSLYGGSRSVYEGSGGQELYAGTKSLYGGLGGGVQRSDSLWSRPCRNVSPKKRDQFSLLSPNTSLTSPPNLPPRNPPMRAQHHTMGRQQTASPRAQQTQFNYEEHHRRQLFQQQQTNGTPPHCSSPCKSLAPSTPGSLASKLEGLYDPTKDPKEKGRLDIQNRANESLYYQATAGSEGKAEVVFEKRIFDMPTMLDLSVLYVSGNRKQLELMWQSLLKHQPKFIDSVKKGLSFVPTVLDSLGPAAASSSADVCTLVSDSCLSIRAFLETCPEAVSFAWSAEVHHSFSGFYERLLNTSTLGSSVQGKPCVRAKKAILSLYRHLVLENCIQPSLRGENQNILDLIDALTLSLDNEPTFMHDYLLNFPLAVDWLPMSERLQRSHDAANRDFLSQKMQPLLSLAQQISVKKTESPAPSPATSSPKKGGARPKVPLPAVPQEQSLSEVGTSGQVHTIPSSTTPAVPSNGPPSREENRVLTESLVSQVTDLFPDLGKGFIKACLAHYDMDPEAVIDALLTENLPDHLSRMDRAAPDTSPTSPSEEASKKTSKLGAKPKQPSPPSTVKAAPEGAKIYKKDRRNRQSDLKAEYVDKSHLVESVRDAILHTQFEAEDAEDLDPMLQKDMEPLNIALEYDDEYDDTYDALVPGELEPSTEIKDAPSSSDSEDDTGRPDRAAPSSATRGRGWVNAEKPGAARGNPRAKQQYWKDRRSFHTQSGSAGSSRGRRDHHMYKLNEGNHSIGGGKEGGMAPSVVRENPGEIRPQPSTEKTSEKSPPAAEPGASNTETKPSPSTTRGEPNDSDPRKPKKSDSSSRRNQGRQGERMVPLGVEEEVELEDVVEDDGGMY
ncbi:unnamed protein product [Cyprideis torosa]|uniref:Uncharacterized protein n=1 Tax=Cyprideis torosa TaxID=163714 RepID=A0A7R8WGX9_9CRUS|nr:unnamed protein product [Cyprideis torosa]CAG0892608.1 unnamed protein product [Cyprideis torosa]